MADTDYKDWIGKTKTVTDRIEPFRAAALAATLNRPESDAPYATLPALWHWIYFLPRPATELLGADGYTVQGAFLPPIDLPRVMWAGSTLCFGNPLSIGEHAEQRSRVESVDRKQGSSGTFFLVTVRHEIHGKHGLALVERRQLIFREAPSSDAPKPESLTPPAEPAWSHTLTPDPVLLFRYSALKFNSHRIHYDHPYATSVEGYPNLVVHGPLAATLLLETLNSERPDKRFTDLTIRAVRPLFANAPVAMEGAPTKNNGGLQLWTRDDNNGMTMWMTVY